jgi:hypothetical protein
MFPIRRPFLLILPLLVSSLVAQADFPTTTIAQQQAAAYLKPLPDNGVVPLSVIAGDFASNQTAAIGKYNGQRITVIGRIASLSQGNSEKKVLVVTLQDAGATLPAVKAEFLLGSLPENSELEISQDGSMATMIKRDRTGVILSRQPYLSVDQRVAIKGSYKEIRVGDIVLTDCKLEPKSKVREASGGN